MTVDQNQVTPVPENNNPVSAQSSENASQGRVAESGLTQPTQPEVAQTAIPEAAGQSVSTNDAAEMIPATAESAIAGVEVSLPQMTTPTVSTFQDDQASQDDSVAPQAQPVPVLGQNTPSAQAAVDDTAAFAGDDIYLREASKVIRDDAEKPFEEEEDLENIQRDYLEKRFDFKVGKDQE